MDAVSHESLRWSSDVLWSLFFCKESVSLAVLIQTRRVYWDAPRAQRRSFFLPRRPRYLCFFLPLPFLLFAEMEKGCESHINHFSLLVHIIGHWKQNTSPKREKKYSMHMFIKSLRVCSVCVCLRVSECVLLFFLPSCSFHLLVSVSYDILALLILDFRPHQKLTATQPLYSRLNATGEAAAAVVSFLTLYANQTFLSSCYRKIIWIFIFYFWSSVLLLSPHNQSKPSDAPELSKI